MKGDEVSFEDLGTSLLATRQLLSPLSWMLVCLSGLFVLLSPIYIRAYCIFHFFYISIKVLITHSQVEDFIDASGKISLIKEEPQPIARYLVMIPLIELLIHFEEAIEIFIQKT